MSIVKKMFHVKKATPMYKFVLLQDIHGREYLINVSQIIFIEYDMPNKRTMTLGFEDGSRLTFQNSREIYEMLILNPWQMNLLNFFRRIFRKKK